MAKFGMTIAVEVEATSEEDSVDKIKEALLTIGVKGDYFEIEDGPGLISEEEETPEEEDDEE